jgi:predicted phage baseplate assembly protein
MLKSPLLHCYDRAATTVNVNVGLATHGQSVTEVMGSGSASTPNQSFALRQSPLTYVQAPTPTGRQSTLEVKANGMTWQEVPFLYQKGPAAQVFATRNQSDGSAQVLFGDGVEGATLPTGQNNLQASYRIGSGSPGNVGAATITTLMDRPLGVSGVTNPATATSGQDPQSVNDVRTNAPQTVLTLGRAVSLADYQNFASTFAGIAKAYAIWLPSGPGRGVFITVAGAGGAALPPANPTLGNLVTALQNYGNPLIPIRAVTFIETLFGLSADIAYDPRFDQPTIQSLVKTTLYQAYSFDRRTFGQGVSADEVAALIQSVAGVVAVNVTGLHAVASSTAGDLAGQGGAVTLSKLNAWLAGQVTLPRLYNTTVNRICAFLPVADPLSIPLAAEILVLDPDPKQLVLGVMA